MPEIKLKHVASFSSEDKVHKAENLIKPETYRKWKCATPGEKNATILLQFEKASQINSIDIGNESSAFIEILVGRSSDNLNDFQVLLVASSFMSPLESRNESHTNRVRMFGPDKLSQSVKDEKWDSVQIVCTQPFNKNITYGLSFIKFHSPSEKITEAPKTPEAENATAKIGAFKLKSDDEEDSPFSVGSFFGKKKSQDSQDKQSSTSKKEAPSYAAAVLAASSNTPNRSPKNNAQKRKSDDNNDSPSNEPPAKKSPANSLSKDYIVYKDLDIKEKKANAPKSSVKKDVLNNKRPEIKMSLAADKPSTSRKPAEKVKKKVPFGQMMKKVVFVLSGFVNPMRSELRDKALEMGAKYKGDWNSTCTHLVCAFLHTPKYNQVRGNDGRVVKKEWITDCYKKKTLLPWRDYMLGSYDKDTSGDEASETTDNEKEDRRKVKNDIRTNGTKTPSKKTSPIKIHSQPIMQDDENGSRDDSETEDEDALEDYMAATDVESDSGGDTEDEIRKVESKPKKKTGNSPSKIMSEEDPSLSEKPNVDDLPLPDLPNLFKRKHFFFFGDFSALKLHDLQRYITAYNGIIEDYMSDRVKYVITESKWDKNFEEALSDNEDLIFIKPLWIYKCHEAGKMVPYQPYIIIPDS